MYLRCLIFLLKITINFPKISSKKSKKLNFLSKILWSFVGICFILMSQKRMFFVINTYLRS